MNHWNKLSGEVIEALAQKNFKARFGWGLGQSGLLRRVPAYGKDEWTAESLKVTCNLNYSMVLLFLFKFLRFQDNTTSF